MTSIGLQLLGQITNGDRVAEFNLFDLWSGRGRRRLSLCSRRRGRGWALCFFGGFLLGGFLWRRCRCCCGRSGTSGSGSRSGRALRFKAVEDNLAQCICGRIIQGHCLVVAEVNAHLRKRGDYLLGLHVQFLCEIYYSCLSQLKTTPQFLLHSWRVAGWSGFHRRNPPCTLHRPMPCRSLARGHPVTPNHRATAPPAS